MSYSSVVLADSPIRYYRLSESGGTVAVDLGSQAQNGTISATGITYNQTGLIVGDASTSMLFDGANGTITFPTTGLPTGAGAWSIEAWVKLPAIPLPTANFPDILEMGTATTNEKIVLYYFGNRFSVSGNAGTNELDSPLIPSPAGAIYHVVVTYDGTTQKMYLNGVSVGSNVVTYNLILGGSNDIGGHSATSSWSGWIDEVAIYASALSATQVATHYTAGTAPILITPRYTPRALGGTIIPPVIKPPLAYGPRALGSTLIYESRTFVPRALGGVYIPDTVMWVPRAIGSTVQSALLRPLTLAGTGTLTGMLLANGVAALTAYPNSAAASATLSTANQLVGNATIATNAGVPKTHVDASTGFGEVCSQQQNGAWLGHVGAITDAACNPTGHGWFLDASTLDLQDIVAGNWVPHFRHVTSANSYTCDMYCRAFVYNSGTYTLIGSAMLLSTQTVNTTIANYSWTAASLAAASFPTGSHLYIDLWHNILTTTCVSGNTVQVNQSSIAGDGLAAVNVATPGFQPTSGGALAVTIAGVGTLTGTLTLATALTDTLAGVGTLTGTLSASVPLSCTIPGVGTLAGTFTLATNLTDTIPGVGTLSPTLSANTALATTIAGAGTLTATLTEATVLATTIAGVGTLTGTLAANTALSVTIAGIGTLTGTLSTSGNVALSTTIPGVGTLTGTLSLATALAVTEVGVGTLTGTMSAKTALTDTMAGVGVLTGTMSANTALTCTMQGVGTLTGTMSVSGNVALATTIAGVGTLSATLSANLTLAPVTMAGVGTLTATMAAQMALIVSLAGTGTLSGVFSLRVALSLTFAGIGTLTGAISIPVTVFLSATCVTRDMQARASTRDMQAIAMTRDEKISTQTRDEKATATTRDEKAIATTRS